MVLELISILLEVWQMVKVYCNSSSETNGNWKCYTEYWLTRDGTTNTNDFTVERSLTATYLNGSSTAQGIILHIV